MPVFTSATVDALALTPTKRTTTESAPPTKRAATATDTATTLTATVTAVAAAAAAASNTLVDQTNGTIAHPDEIIPLGSPDTVIIKNYRCLTHMAPVETNEDTSNDDDSTAEPPHGLGNTTTETPSCNLLYTEPILTAPKSLALNPKLLDPEGYGWFKRQQACLWTSEEIDTASDVHDYNKLSPPEQAFVKQILAFFASADLIVLDNLMEQFGTEVCAYDLKLFFVVQAYIEAVHSETYSNLLTAIVKDPTEQHQLFDAVTTFPSI